MTHDNTVDQDPLSLLTTCTMLYCIVSSYTKCSNSTPPPLQQAHGPNLSPFSSFFLHFVLGLPAGGHNEHMPRIAAEMATISGLTQLKRWARYPGQPHIAEQVGTISALAKHSCRDGHNIRPYPHISAEMGTISGLSLKQQQRWARYPALTSQS